MGNAEEQRNEKAAAEVECETPSERRKTWGGVAKMNESEKTQTPRLRAPVGTPVETGVGRPDGRKPEDGEGAGPGSGGVTVNPVARRERKRHRKTCERNCVKSGFMTGYAPQAGEMVLPGVHGKGNGW